MLVSLTGGLVVSTHGSRSDATQMNALQPDWVATFERHAFEEAARAEVSNAALLKESISMNADISQGGAPAAPAATTSADILPAHDLPPVKVVNPPLPAPSPQPIVPSPLPKPSPPPSSLITEQLTHTFQSADDLGAWRDYFESVYGVSTMTFPFSLASLNSSTRIAYQSRSGKHSESAAQTRRAATGAGMSSTLAVLCAAATCTTCTTAITSFDASSMCVRASPPIRRACSRASPREVPKRWPSPAHAIQPVAPAAAHSYSSGKASPHGPT